MKGQKLLVILLLTIHLVRGQDNGKPAFPAVTGWVADKANILSQQEEAQLSQKISAFEKATGHEIGILTITSVHPLSIEEYAIRLFNQWGIGKKERNNGVLIMAAVLDRKMRIEVGEGLTGMLTNDTCAAIIRDHLRPAFRKGEYHTGFNAAVNAIINILNGDVALTGPLQPQHSGQAADNGSLQITINGRPVNKKASGGPSWMVFIPVFIIAGIGILLILLFSSAKKGKAGNGRDGTPLPAADDAALYSNAGFAVPGTFTSGSDTGMVTDNGSSGGSDTSTFSGGESSGNGASGSW